MNQMIAVDARALDALVAKIDRLQATVDAAMITQKPKWITIGQYAEKIGRSRKTILRRISAHQLESQDIDGVQMVRASQDV
jgi:hypothetical protein